MSDKVNTRRFPGDWPACGSDPANPRLGRDHRPAPGERPRIRRVVFARDDAQRWDPPIWLVASNMSIEGASDLPVIARTLPNSPAILHGFSHRAFSTIQRRPTRWRKWI